jgi:hypothetical protein
VANHACGGDHDRGPLEDRYSGGGAESGDWPRGRNGLHQLPVLLDARVVGSAQSRGAHDRFWRRPRLGSGRPGASAQDSTRRLASVLDDPDYNAVIQSAPPGDESREYFVWHLRIVPRLAIPAGFELGSGMATDPTLPEEPDALRRAIQQSASPLSISLARDHPRGIGTYRAGVSSLSARPSSRLVNEGSSMTEQRFDVPPGHRKLRVARERGLPLVVSQSHVRALLQEVDQLQLVAQAVEPRSCAPFSAMSPANHCPTAPARYC